MKHIIPESYSPNKRHISGTVKSYLFLTLTIITLIIASVISTILQKIAALLLLK